ncbi:NADP-dependent aldehyde dehydrogenase [Nocardioides terrae]|uniref:2,5-dioxovalerate dehydrogenase n=1 Tax=Nocardioides terrae TaxID=574651 RepID=A0A1I1KEQ8_9ACTN|nr:aldehyde dehydrogenase (NADP(+)) [Nocardioides terrae]SFC59101.1 NADP-dependent aldehyde dehydrogenase [Nocardioides terrae]
MTATALTGAMFLGSKRVAGDGTEVRAIDPRTGEQLEPTYRQGDASHVEYAARLAAEAFGVYRETTPEQRASFLDRIADNIDALGDTLVDRVVRETGIVEPRVRGEMARTTNQLRLFARVVREGSWAGARIDPALPDRMPLPRPDLRQRKVPLGPVVVFGASNFPLAFSVAGGDTAAALAAGCPVIVKAHNAHPGVSELVAGAIADAVATSGLPEGVFSMIFGSGSGVGIGLVSDPRVKAVGFTGSRQAGLSLMAAAASRPVPIPVYAEMSSINPVFLMPGALAADAEGLAAAYVASLTVGVGQLCTNPGLVFAVDGPDLDRFLEAAGAAVTQSPALPMLNPGIQRSYTEGVARLQDLPTVTEVGAGGVDEAIAAPGQAHVFATSVTDFSAEPAMREEVFGSSSLVVRLGDAGDFAAAAGDLEGQLTATVHAAPSDYAAAAGLVPALEDKVGRIIFNGWPTGVEVSHAMVHGGPFPATSDGRSTSVGTLAIERFLRPVAYQDLPAELLPPVLAAGNPLGAWRLVDGELTRG